MIDMVAAVLAPLDRTALRVQLPFVREPSPVRVGPGEHRKAALNRVPHGMLPDVHRPRRILEDDEVIADVLAPSSGSRTDGTNRLRADTASRRSG